MRSRDPLNVSALEDEDINQFKARRWFSAATFFFSCSASIQENCSRSMYIQCQFDGCFACTYIHTCEYIRRCGYDSNIHDCSIRSSSPAGVATGVASAYSSGTARASMHRCMRATTIVHRWAGDTSTTRDSCYLRRRATHANGRADWRLEASLFADRFTQASIIPG